MTNKEEIIYIPREVDNTCCAYCGISSFSHKHPVNTKPKDFIRGLDFKDESHEVEDDYCCACEYDIAVFEEKLKEAKNNA